jgi:hypothetical protein
MIEVEVTSDGYNIYVPYISLRIKKRVDTEFLSNVRTQDESDPGKLTLVNVVKELVHTSTRVERVS